ncbi:MAG: O-antigen ligase family protein [bacterium]|nr:O-antigen ligase family protein [bacterium]
MQQANALQQWVAKADRRLYALIIGLGIGLIGGLIGLLIAASDPLIALGLVFGLLAGLYILTSVEAALYGIIGVMALLPFGTLPFRIGFTPTFMDAAMLAFLVVYLTQWMTGKRGVGLRLTPVHPLIALYIGWLILAFMLGLQYAPPNSTTLRQFAETLLSISMTFILVDLLRDLRLLRRLVLVIMLAVGAQALIAVVLYGMNDATAERTLLRLVRFGYPNGGVIRYLEDDPAQAERAIGTWVDPNALGGFLVISALMIAPQVFARKPVLRFRWLAWGVLGLVVLALVLTFSRASALAFGFGLAFIGLFQGYRRYLTLIVLGVCALLVLPQTQDYIVRFVEAFTAQDLATQMRIGEYGDAFELIAQYPLAGVGFTGTPVATLYTDVASMYLIMANQIGLVGVAVFALAILGVFAYGLHAWRKGHAHDDVRAIHLGFHTALIGVLINSTADLYFFRLDFHAAITLFWLVIALCLTSSRLMLERAAESTVDPA